MSSGRKAVQQNTLERVVSSDWNRMQRFAGGFDNEALRRQVLAPIDDTAYVGTTFTAPGPISAAFDVLAPAAPDYAGILNGLMVVVPAAATYVLVTSGAMTVVDPEGQPGSSDPSALNPDDGPGPARAVYSDGVSLAGSLVWAPNPGPGTRVDVVECQRNQVVAETDNRDIFDPSTGLFTPQAVTKVTNGGLTYRIRQGVAGGGIPAPALGWVPLAIIAAPAGAVDLDACHVWDVRPLLSDLARPFAQVRSIIPTLDRWQMVCEDKSAVGQLRLSGESQGNYLGWRMGGLFREPDVATFIDLANTPFYQATGFVPVAGLPYYVYSLWPGGYLRWVRYTPTPVAGVGGRTPSVFRGIVTVSQVPPLNGQPLAPVATPPAWGLNASTVFGQMMAAGRVDTAAVLRGFIADGDMVHHTAENPVAVGPFSVVNISPGIDDANYVLTPGIDFPAGAKRVKVQTILALNGFAAGNIVYLAESARVVDFAGGLPMAELGGDVRALVRPSATALLAYSQTWDLPVAADGISSPPALGFQFTYARLDAGFGVGGVASASLQVIGWDL